MIFINVYLAIFKWTLLYKHCILDCWNDLNSIKVQFLKKHFKLVILSKERYLKIFSFFLFFFLSAQQLTILLIFLRKAENFRCFSCFLCLEYGPWSYFIWEESIKGKNSAGIYGRKKRIQAYFVLMCFALLSFADIALFKIEGFFGSLVLRMSVGAIFQNHLLSSCFCVIFY